LRIEACVFVEKQSGTKHEVSGIPKKALRDIGLGGRFVGFLDKAFDREWALALLNLVLNRLEDEYQRDGKMELFNSLKQTLMGSRESQPYGELAEGLLLPNDDR